MLKKWTGGRNHRNLTGKTYIIYYFYAYKFEEKNMLSMLYTAHVAKEYKIMGTILHRT